MDKRELIQKELTQKGVDFFKSNNKGVYDVTTRLGKTFVVTPLLKGKVLICYPDNRIKDSWIGTFETLKFDYSFIDFCHFVSLDKFNTNKYDYLIIDEGHTVNSDTQKENIEIAIRNSKNCLMLTGTFTDECKEYFKDLGFKLIAEYTAEQGIEDGLISDYQLTIHYADLDDKIKTLNKQKKLVTEKKRFENYTFVIDKMKREGKDFGFLAIQRNRISQTSLGKRNKCLELLKQLKDKRVIVFTGFTEQADNLNIASYHSKNEKLNNLEKFNNLEFNHLALGNMGKIGANFNSLDSVILLSWSGNEADIYQRISRAMILDYGDKIADIHIICLQEKSEVKKLNKALELIDKTKIKWE